MSVPLRVVALKPFYPADLALLREGLGATAELVVPAAFDPATLSAAVRGADVLLGGAVTEEILDAAKGFRLFQVPWTGVDGLDRALLSRRGAVVCNSHSSAPVVAEFAVALLLAALKTIPLHDRRLREGDWMRPQPGGGDFRPPRTLAGCVVAFLGAGAIARATASLLAGFGVRQVAVASRRRAEPAPWSAVSGPEGLDAALAGCDALVVAAPLTAVTAGMIDARRLALMKPTAVLVNVARAEIVEEGALFEALKSGRLGAAALDPWREQPKAGAKAFPSPRFPFHELPNVVLSPHRAGFDAGRLPHLVDAVANIRALAEGRALANRVDLEAGY
ncbi:MAG: NAD(P)-dependent oxidoreductase [Bacteroidota bacterium]